MKVKIFVALLFIIGPAALFAQTANVLKQHGLKKLSVFIGTWKSQNTSKGAPNISAIYTCKWSVNGNYLIADQLVNNNGNKINNLSIYSYNSATDSYTLSLVGIPGMAPFSIPVTYQGDMLIYTGTSYINNGQKIYNRTLNIFSSPYQYTYQVQSSTDSIHWTTSMEGRSVKIARRK